MFTATWLDVVETALAWVDPGVGVALTFPFNMVDPGATVESRLAVEVLAIIDADVAVIIDGDDVTPGQLVEPGEDVVVMFKAKHRPFQSDQFVEPAIVHRLPVPKVQING